MPSDPIYEDIDDTGLPANQKKMDLDAREPKTAFEETLLSLKPAPRGRTVRFASRQEHVRARKLEHKMTADDNGRIFRAFAWVIIKWGKDKNKKAGRYAIGVNEVMSAIEDPQKYADFKARHGAEVLKKQTAAQLASSLKKAGVTSLTELYTQRNNVNEAED